MRGLARTRLAGSVQDAGWSAFAGRSRSVRGPFTDRERPCLDEPYGINRRPMLIDRLDW
ncbi:hypothetical protein ACGRHY_23255 [Streptomyces sp. HK10]|uniref:hypothetical protein n=1 Tax=Streptomyces sp. HK10 TaxID=3373255 RepID=UPI0037483083